MQQSTATSRRSEGAVKSEVKRECEQIEDVNGMEWNVMRRLVATIFTVVGCCGVVRTVQLPAAECVINHSEGATGARRVGEVE